MNINSLYKFLNNSCLIRDNSCFIFNMNFHALGIPLGDACVAKQELNMNCS